MLDDFFANIHSHSYFNLILLLFMFISIFSIISNYFEKLTKYALSIN